jgi:hypothetical protein
MNNGRMRPLPRHSKIVIEHKPQGIYLRIPLPRNKPTATGIIVIGIIAPVLFFSYDLLQAWHNRNYLFLTILVLVSLYGASYSVIVLYRLLRPIAPERWVLLEKGFHFDSGLAPPLIETEDFGPRRTPFLTIVPEGQKHWQELIDADEVFEKRQWLYLTLDEVATLRLRHQRPRNNQLFIYHENEPIELAKGVSTKERKWLYDFLKAHYYLGD